MSANETIFVFPGQGSQSVGMAAEFMLQQELSPLFDAANTVLGFDVAELMKNGPAEDLSQTQNTQPALVVAGYAAFQHMLKTSGKTLPELVQCVAGHSLGEYTALAAAGALSFEDAVRLVRLRGEAMAKAVPSGQGAMAAILGLTAVDVDSICLNAGCYFANDNSDGQAVISGSVEAVDEASNIAVMQDAKKVVRLDVSGPFHSPLMQPAADVMAEELAKIEIKTPEVPVICNVTTQPTTNPDHIRENLVAQVTGQVRWRESMVYAAEQGVTQVVELGAGKVLAGLAKRCDARLKGKALQTPLEVDTYADEATAAAA